MINNPNPRITTLHTSPITIVASLSEDNPGAATVLLNIAETLLQYERGYGATLGAYSLLDDLGCYGPRIWQLYKDVCDCDVFNLLTVLRATTLGLISKPTFDLLVDGTGEKIDLKVLTANVLTATRENRESHKTR